MTSREIAELVESRHDDVKRSIKRLADRGVIGLPPMAEYLDALGRPAQEYRIGKRDSYVIVAQLSPEFTARLVDRWQALESGVATPAFAIPSTLSGALRLAAEQAEVIEHQAAELALAAPARAFVERYVDSTGTKGFRQVCKLLKANEAEFREFLSEQKVMYKLGGEWVPYSEHIDAGRFVVRAGTADSGHAFNSARFTPKGVTWVAGEWAKHQIQGEL
jgi:phage antirepressor YoqD-like protein